VTTTVCRIVGFALLLAGLLGFASPRLLGLHLTPLHNLVHLASGGLALFFGYPAPRGSRGFATLFGTVYLLLGVLGFLAPSLVAGLIGHPGFVSARELMPDNVAHALLGGVLLGAAWASAGHPKRPAVRVRKA
jgi:hypothetical protein